MRQRNKTIFLLLVISLLPCGLSAQSWIVPPEQARALSPFAFNEDTHKAGEAIYTQNCRSCHGEPGKNNAVAMAPKPPDPASEQMQHNSDGEMYYKIREGRSLMPPFKNTLSIRETWTVVSYIRSLNNQYKQEVAVVAVIPGKTIIRINWRENNYQVETVLSNEHENVIKPLGGEEIQLFAERYFGDLAIDSVKLTNNQGKAIFNVPKDIPGDSAGNLHIYAKLSDEAKYGEVEIDTIIKAGIPTWKPPLNEGRTMWNIVQETPLWLLFSYVLTVLFIWGVIFYVLYLLRVIYLIGKENKTENHI